MNSKPLGWFGVLWLRSAGLAVAVRWQRSYPFLTLLGVLMILMAASNVVGLLRGRKADEVDASSRACVNMVFPLLAILGCLLFMVLGLP